MSKEINKVRCSKLKPCKLPKEEYPLGNIVNYREDPLEELQRRTDAEEAVAKAMVNLTEKEKQVIKLYFGLDAEDCMNSTQISKTISISRELVDEIFENALFKMRLRKIDW